MNHHATLGAFGAALLSILSAWGCSSSSSQPASSDVDASDQDGNSQPMDSATHSSSGGGSSGGSSGGSNGGSSGASSGVSSGGSNGVEASTGDDGSAADGTASDGGQSDSGADAGNCAPCPAMYSCVANPGSVGFTDNDTQDPDGTCHISGITLYCGGTGKAADGTSLTWVAGPSFGPSGGAGIFIQTSTLGINCE